MPGVFGIRRDAAAAVRHFVASASLGYGPALHALGFAHAVGLGGVEVRPAAAGGGVTVAVHRGLYYLG